MIEQVKTKCLTCDICLDESTTPVGWGVTAKKIRADAHAQSPEEDPWYRMRLTAEELDRLSAEQRARVRGKMADVGPTCYAIIEPIL